MAFYFAFDQSGKLVLDRTLFNQYEKRLTFGKRVFHAIKQRSYLASLISERLYLLKLQRRNHSDRDNARKQQSRLDGGSMDEFSHLNIYRADMSKSWKEAFVVTKAILRKFRDKVEANGSEFLLVTLSNAEQVHPEVQEGLRKQYRADFDFEQPDRIIGEFASREQITHLQLMPSLREFHLQTGTYVHGFGGSKGGHWNETGHRLAAEKVFEFLKKRDLLVRTVESRTHTVLRDVVPLSSHARSGLRLPDGRSFTGQHLLGWGSFNLVDGMIDHHLLEMYYVRDLPVHVPIYDGYFSASAA